MKNRFNVDYYITEQSNKPNDYSYNIVNKLKFTVVSSSSGLDDNFDIFIKKIDVGREPSKYDLAFFIKEMKFYNVKSFEDAGDFYIVNIQKYNQLT